MTMSVLPTVGSSKLQFLSKSVSTCFRKWEPLITIPDYTDKYLNDWPIDYAMAENPLMRNINLSDTNTYSEKELLKCLHVPIKTKEKSKEEAIHELLHPNEIKEDILLKDSIPAITSVRERKRNYRAENNRSLSKWFGLPRQELTEENKQDMEILRMRQSLDPKHFYKRPDRTQDLKYFQTGRFADDAHDFHNRLSKKQRKTTLVDELLDNENFMDKQKKRYQKIKTDNIKRDRSLQMKQKRMNKRREKNDRKKPKS